MPNPITPLINKHLGPQFVPSLLQRVVGLAKDFWADGPDNLLKVNFNWKLGAANKPQTQPSVYAAPAPTQPDFAAHVMQAASNGDAWHAEAGEISEKMWGPGFVTPGGMIISAMLVKPLNLTKDMNVLDLSAGLGNRIRRIADETGAHVTGLEPDAAVAKRGMAMSLRAGKAEVASIEHYDTAKPVLHHLYDCVIARETFYRVPDRTAFLDVIGKHTKPKSQVAFTDYIVDAEHRGNPAISAWLAHETIAKPAGLVEAAEHWAKIGFTLSTHEDLTDLYKAEVKIGMKRLMDYLASGVRPDRETGDAVLRRIELWKHRIAAMETGMKIYRFYGTKG